MGRCSSVANPLLAPAIFRRRFAIRPGISKALIHTPRTLKKTPRVFRRTWLKRSVLGGTSLSFFSFGTSKRNEGDNPDDPSEELSQQEQDPDVVEANIEAAKPPDNAKDNAESTWHGLDILKQSVSVKSISSALSTWSWPTPPDFASLQERVSALILELGMGPGSLYSEIVHDPPDPQIYPEVEWDAEVRLGEDLCLSEKAFLKERKRKMKGAFAQLFGVEESEIDERDLPIVALAGSGGGYRAMLNTVGSLIGAQSSGLLPCLTYAAGVSGSCWALSVLYSGVAGSIDPKSTAEHLKGRIETSYLDTATLDLLTNPPTNKYLLSGILRKAASPSGVASLVDVYGTLLASRLFVPSDTSKLDFKHLSLHFQRRCVDNGEMPLPIFTAIQHATPPATLQAIRNVKHERERAIDQNRQEILGHAQSLLEDETRCLWYEFTPFEVGCDEIGAWIPSWSLGRQFANGKNVERRPELGLTILTGIFGSAFCASLKHYFKEIQPTLKLLPFQLYDWLEDIVTENERDLGLIHPVFPDQIPNFLKGLDGQLRDGSPPDLAERDFMTFMDAGAELNLPYYPLLRRDVDCIIALDASADSQDLWFTRAEELAAKRGLRTWPKGAGWPTAIQASAEDPAEATRNSSAPSVEDEADSANVKLAQTQESALADQAGKQEVTEDKGIPKPGPTEAAPRSQPLSSCEVWIGTSRSSENEASSRLDDLDEEALLRRDGLGVVYIPLAPNERKAPGFDPFTISTWRREVAPEESQSLLDVAEVCACKTNFTFLQRLI
ncbi:FabD/lysophospholipase-like protein [Panus rudis PR-1116 ss-1]|nr:FabD/lysophospholipase-like protein [Panus rudis PR-1116 ss-1]